MMMSKEYFKNWNYKKHAKFCTAVYLGLYAIDMTISYFILKKYFDKSDAEDNILEGEKNDNE